MQTPNIYQRARSINAGAAGPGGSAGAKIPNNIMNFFTNGTHNTNRTHKPNIKAATLRKVNPSRLFMPFEEQAYAVRLNQLNKPNPHQAYAVRLNQLNKPSPVQPNLSRTRNSGPPSSGPPGGSTVMYNYSSPAGPYSLMSNRPANGKMPTTYSLATWAPKSRKNRKNRKNRKTRK